MGVDVEAMTEVSNISGEYRKWKADTLAKQKTHKEEMKTTELWQKVREEEQEDEEGGKDVFVVVLAPGWR